MAEVVKNDKGFKVIHCSITEIVDLGGLGICDYCNNASYHGFYIAVLNAWYCPKCYERWHKEAVYYPEDKPIEDKNFKVYSKLLGL